VAAPAVALFSCMCCRKKACLTRHSHLIPTLLGLQDAALAALAVALYAVEGPEERLLAYLQVQSRLCGPLSWSLPCTKRLVSSTCTCIL